MLSLVTLLWVAVVAFLWFCIVASIWAMLSIGTKRGPSTRTIKVDE